MVWTRSCFVGDGSPIAPGKYHYSIPSWTASHNLCLTASLKSLLLIENLLYTPDLPILEAYLDAVRMRC